MLLSLITIAWTFIAGAKGLYHTGRLDRTHAAAPESWFPSPRGGTVKEWTDSYSKAAALVRQMTLVDKVNITTGTGWRMDLCVGNTGRVDRLKFPSLCLQDGPLGLRFSDHITAFPAGLSVGATWNKDLMYERGKALGAEARAKGVNVLLGPSIGPIGRLPAGGRNWEGFGADPVLQAYAAARTIEGVQSQAVIATVKHFVGNEQEHHRQPGIRQEALSANIDDRTLHEIYAWPFADAIRAGVASLMCSYQQVNNSYACENSKLLNGIIKDEFSFQGFVQSDWLAQRSGVNSALSGLDVTMPGDGLIWEDGSSLWGSELTKSVLNGTIPLERLDDMVLRVVASWYQLGQDNTEKWPTNGGPNFSSWTKSEYGHAHEGSHSDTTRQRVNYFVAAQADHHKLARQIAAEAIVMVKNHNDVLPLPRTSTEQIPNTGRKLKLGLFGEGGFPNPEGPNACEDRACNRYTMGSGWGSGAVEFPYLISPAEAIHAAYDNHTVEIRDYPTNTPDFESAADLDYCLVFVSSISGEGYLSWNGIDGDRNDLYSNKAGDDLVEGVADKCGNGHSPVIVIVHGVGPIIVERWIDHRNIKAVLFAHLPGQESGHALADVLFGDVNPSGRLPYTVARHEDDYGPDSKILIDRWNIVPQQNFSERMYIDYRYFDTFDKKPRFEFGYGLSYSRFAISNVTATPVNKDRTALPAPRAFEYNPPELPKALPPPEDALWPQGMRKLSKYIYPYLTSASEAQPREPYPYPKDYHKMQKPSEAGGGLGGNPDLFTTLVTVTADIDNLGDRSGSCVAQLYVSFPDSMVNSLGEPIDMPPRVLRGFEKVQLGSKTSESSRTSLSMELRRRDLSFWDRGVQNWVLPTDGVFRVWLGQSSRKFDNGTMVVIPFSEP